MHGLADLTLVWRVLGRRSVGFGGTADSSGLGVAH